MDEKTYTIMVLNDGETYSDLDGCSIYTVTEEGMDKLGEGEKLSQLDQKDIRKRESWDYADHSNKA